MELNRTTLQSQSADIEYHLAQYSSQYPVNTGSVLQKHVSLLFVLLGAALLGISHASNPDLDMLGMFSLIGGLAMWISYMCYLRWYAAPQNTVSPEIIEDKINRLRSISGNYDEILRYCDTLTERLHSISAKKKKCKPTFFIIMAAMLAAIIIISPRFKVGPFQKPTNERQYTLQSINPDSPYGQSLTMKIDMDLSGINSTHRDTIIGFHITDSLSAEIAPSSSIKAYQILLVDQSGATLPMLPTVTATQSCDRYYCKTPLFHALELIKKLDAQELKFKINPIYNQ